MERFLFILKDLLVLRGRNVIITNDSVTKAYLFLRIIFILKWPISKSRSNAVICPMQWAKFWNQQVGKSRSMKMKIYNFTGTCIHRSFHFFSRVAMMDATQYFLSEVIFLIVISSFVTSNDLQGKVLDLTNWKFCLHVHSPRYI